MLSGYGNTNSEIDNKLQYSTELSGYNYLDILPNVGPRLLNILSTLNEVGLVGSHQ